MTARLALLLLLAIPSAASAQERIQLYFAAGSSEAQVQPTVVEAVRSYLSEAAKPSPGVGKRTGAPIDAQKNNAQFLHTAGEQKGRPNGLTAIVQVRADPASPNQNLVAVFTPLPPADELPPVPVSLALKEVEAVAPRLAWLAVLKVRSKQGTKARCQAADAYDDVLKKWSIAGASEPIKTLLRKLQQSPLATERDCKASA